VTATNAFGSVTKTIYLMVVNATYVVNDTTDVANQTGTTAPCRGTGLPVGSCSLRAALQLAQAATGGANQTIYLKNGTYDISSGGFTMTTGGGLTDLSLVGQSQSSTVITAASAVRAFVITSLNASLSGLTLQSSVSTNDGGGIRYTTATAGKTFTATSVKFKSNQVTVAINDGGAVGFQNGGAANGTVTFDRCVFDSNSTTGGNGGAISYQPAAGSGPLTISNSYFYNNTAGGAGYFGGAIVVVGAYTLDVTSSTFESNTNTSGTGGAIGLSSATANITNTTFQANTANYGAALYMNNGAPAFNVKHSTFRSNTAVNAAGGGAIYTFTGTTTYFGNVFSGNTANSAPVNCTTAGGTMTSTGYNYADSAGGACVSTIGTDNSAITSASMLLDSLADNTGPVKTIALQSGSPLLNVIPAASCTTVTTDARGTTRPTGAGCEPGAYEN